MLINAAQTAMATSHFDDAEAMTIEGLKRWADADLNRNTGYRVGQALLATLQLLRGQPRLALASFDEIAAAPDPGENLPAAAARRSSHARALSMMSRHDEAIAMARESSRQFCAAVGAGTPDCLRMRLNLVDVAIAAGRSDIGQPELDDVRSLAGDAPPAIIAPALLAYAALLHVLDEPSTVNVAAVDRALSEIAAQGPNGPRNALRLRLGAADRLLASGDEALASAMMVAALGSADKLVNGGVNGALLALWRSSADETTAADYATAWRALADQLGQDHPTVLRWKR